MVREGNLLDPVYHKYNALNLYEYHVEHFSVFDLVFEVMMMMMMIVMMMMMKAD